MIYRRNNKHTIDSIVGVGNNFSGEFQIVGYLRVDGTLRGQINSDSTLFISGSGKGEGSIEAKNIEIGGEFVGSLYATGRVELRSTACVKGEIIARYLVVEEGAFYCGNCKITTNIMSFSPKKLDNDEEKSDEDLDQKTLLTTR